jgi:hypothetical protein
MDPVAGSVADCSATNEGACCSVAIVAGCCVADIAGCCGYVVGSDPTGGTSCLVGDTGRGCANGCGASRPHSGSVCVEVEDGSGTPCGVRGEEGVGAVDKIGRVRPCMNVRTLDGEEDRETPPWHEPQSDDLCPSSVNG